MDIKSCKNNKTAYITYAFKIISVLTMFVVLASCNNMPRLDDYQKVWASPMPSDNFANPQYSSPLNSPLPSTAPPKPLAPISSSYPTISATSPQSNTANHNSNITFKKLSGKKICIDPGHGRTPKVNNTNDLLAPCSKELKPSTVSGASGIYTKANEYKLNLDVSMKLKSQLIMAGAEVIMTRETNDYNISNIERAEIANKNNVDICVRIHADSNSDDKVRGISVLIPSPKYISDTNLLAKSKSAGKCILDSLINSTNAISLGLIERSDLVGFNWSKRPVVLIEMGFMSNEEEDKLLSSKIYQDKIVTAIMRGLNNYFE